MNEQKPCEKHAISYVEVSHRLDKLESIDAGPRLDSLESYRSTCENNHHNHSTKDEIQSMSVARHLELINHTIATQDNMVLSIKSLSESISSISKFIKDNEKALELVVSVVVGLQGFKKVLLGTAALVAALGVILGGALTAWSILNAPSLLEALKLMKDLQ